MKVKKSLLVVTAALVCCGMMALFSASIHGGQKTYEVEPQITIPEYRTDAARAIDAYERLMERHIDLTEGNFARLGVDLKSAAKRLDSIDARLTDLSTRIARIEKALGIEQPKLPVKAPQPKALSGKIQEKSSPSP